MYTKPLSPDEIYHYGILGMHWGIRRYQNYDGSRIGAGDPPVTNKSKMSDTVVGGQGGKAKGLERLAAVANPKAAENIAKKESDESSSNSDKEPSGFFDRTIKRGKDKEKTSPAEEVTRNTRDAAKNSKNLLDVMERHDPKTKQREEEFTNEAKKMSDKDLRDQISRIKMEREYVSLKQQEVETGYQRAREVLDVVGDVASVTLSILGIIALLKGRKLAHEDFTAEEAELQRLINLGGYNDEFIAHAMVLDFEYVENYLTSEVF